VLVVTVFGDSAHVFDAVRCGASGYLLKDASPAEMLAAIHDVLRGGSPMSPGIARRVVEEFRNMAGQADPLSGRERDVLQLLVKGATYDMIGGALGLATGTIQSHIKNIYRKLEVCTKAEAAVEAVRRGIVR
jgi:DNA-binding NarL/FixJ family response regulator